MVKLGQKLAAHPHNELINLGSGLPLMAQSGHANDAR
jgi:hypothetical protein